MFPLASSQQPLAQSLPWLQRVQSGKPPVVVPQLAVPPVRLLGADAAVVVVVVEVEVLVEVEVVVVEVVLLDWVAVEVETDPLDVPLIEPEVLLPEELVPDDVPWLEPVEVLVELPPLVAPPSKAQTPSWQTWVGMHTEQTPPETPQADGVGL